MKRMICLAVCLLMLPAFHAPAEGTGMDLTALYKDKDVEETWEEKDVTAIAFSGDTCEVSDPGKATVESGKVTVHEKGEYLLTGKYEGQVVIEAGEGDKVRLILHGAEISSPQGPAILETSADKLIVTVDTGTVNRLTDTSAQGEGDDSIAAALYAEDDLSVNGSGELIVTGRAGNGIQSKADLILSGARLTVNAANDAVKGRNSVLVLSGSCTLTAMGDGMVSTREDKEGKGWVVIADGEIRITTGNGAGTAKSVQDMEKGGRGMRSRGGRGWDRDTQSASADTVSRKGIKAETDLTILGGSLVLNTEDDGLHANGSVTVAGGSAAISSGDDGIHADKDMTVSGGTVQILQSYEGIEGENVRISGGVTTILASDDGVNAAGGTTAGNSSRGGFDHTASSSLIEVSGGEVYVTAGGDGLDSNGGIRITGGTIGVCARSSTGEGPVDFNGTGTMEGGTLIIATTGTGRTGLSGQTVMSVPIRSASAGEAVSVYDAYGKVIACFAPQSTFDTLMLASSSLREGDQLEIRSGTQTVYSGSMQDTQSAPGAGGDDGRGGFGNRHRGH